jgi:hypothetical protein
VVCGVLGRQSAQPFAEADDLGTIRGAFRRKQPITQIGSLIDPIAAITPMVAKNAGDQQIDLTFDQLVQAGGLQHPQTDFRMRAAKLRQCQAAQLEAATDPHLKQHRTCRFQMRGRVRNAAKTIGYPRQIGLTGCGQDQLPMQPLEQAYAEARLQRFYLLAHGGGRHVQLMRGQLETEMPRGSLEGAERVEWWKGVGHRGSQFDTDGPQPCNRFSWV